MAMTRLEVANFALRQLGDVPIVTWGEETVNGNLCEMHLPFALSQVLKEGPWPGTLHALQLENTDEVTKEYAGAGMLYAYALPGDLYHLIEVNGKRTGWKLVNNTLHTNEPLPDILYTVEPSQDSIPDTVGHITGYLLAYYLAPSITNDNNKTSMLLQQFNLILAAELGRVERQLGDTDTSDGWWTD